MASEKAFESKIKAYLKKQGAYFVKYFGCSYSQAGVPDILACINGVFVAIEVKASTGRPSALQVFNLRQIDAAGGIALLAYPEDFEQLKALLLALKNSEPYGNIYEPFRWRFCD